MLLSQLYLFSMSNQTSHYVSLKITLAVVHNDFLPFSPLYRNGWAGNISQYILKSKVLLKSIIHGKLSLARTQKAVAFTEESRRHTLNSRDLFFPIFPLFFLFSFLSYLLMLHFFPSFFRLYCPPPAQFFLFPPALQVLLSVFLQEFPYPFGFSSQPYAQLDLFFP